MKRFVISIICLVMVIGVSLVNIPSAHAMDSNLEEGIAQMKLGDTKVAFTAIHEAAEEGVTEAFGKLAWLYLTGTGVKTNMVEALSWAKKGAEADDPESLLVLGWYEMDEAKNRSKAQEIFQRLAESEDPVYRGYALNALGWLSQTSESQPDLEKAKKYYEKAAEAGNPNAMLNLADIYGWSVPEYNDPETALRYYVSELECEPLDISGYFVAGDNYSHNKTNLDQKALQNLRYVGFYLGEPADGSEPNYDLAFRYYEVLANYGDARAAAWLANVYYNESGIEPNLSEYVSWNKRILEIYEAYPSASNNSSVSNEEYARDSALNLGSCYLYAWGVEQDYSKSLYYFSMAYELGLKEAMVNITTRANHFLTGSGKGQGFEQDIPLALVWYNKAIELGSGEAAVELANFYQYGYTPDPGSGLKGFPVDLDRAKEYYDLAESLGYHE